MKCINKVIEIARQKQKNDCDSIFIIVGRVRRGKSNLMLHCAEQCGADIKNIHLEVEKFMNALADSKRYDFVCFDEASDGLNSRDSMNDINKVLGKAYDVIGKMNLITFLVLPNFFRLDVNFRKEKAIGLFEVYERGRVKFYGVKEIEKICQSWKCEKAKKIVGIRPMFFDHFPKYKGRLKAKYEKMKDEKIAKTLADMKKGIIDKNSKPIVEVQEDNFDHLLTKKKPRNETDTDMPFNY
jgi:hypothetical protein